MANKRSVRRAHAARNAVRASSSAQASPVLVADSASGRTPSGIGGHAHPSAPANRGNPSAARITPPDHPQRIDTPEQATALAHRLRELSTPWPVLVLTTAAGQAEPYVPVADLMQEVQGIAEVVVMPTGDASWAFSKALPPLTQVFGGASRVYAPDGSWLANPYSSPLRFSFGASDGSKNVNRLAGDAFAAAPQRSAAPPEQHDRPAGGVVLGTVASRGLVDLDGIGQATIWAELTLPDVPLERLVRKNQHVTGRYDPATRRLDVREMLASGPHVEAAPSDVTHVLARVADVTDDGVSLALLPGHHVLVRWERVGETSVREFYERGDVVVATWWVESDEPELRLDVWSEGEPIAQAPAILPDGPPWLNIADLTLTAPEDVTDEPGSDGASEQPEIDENDPRSLEVAELRRITAQQRAEIERLLGERRELRRRARAGGRRQAGAPEGEELFAFEVWKAWRTRLSDGPPLATVTLGPRFLTSLEELEGVARRKVVDVVVEVATGLAASLPGRDLHRLRSGAGGDDPYIVREDGAKAWRAALQRETASARRLHYWELPDGAIELSRVVAHDDTEP